MMLGPFSYFWQILLIDMWPQNPFQHSALGINYILVGVGKQVKSCRPWLDALSVQCYNSKILRFRFSQFIFYSIKKYFCAPMYVRHCARLGIHW